MRWKRNRCHQCGSVPGEWIDPATRTPRIPEPYRAVVEECVGCRRIYEAGEDLRSDDSSAHAYTRVYLVPPHLHPDHPREA